MKKRQQQDMYKVSYLFAMVRTFFACAVLFVQISLPVAPVFASEDVGELPVESIPQPEEKPEVSESTIYIEEDSSAPEEPSNDQQEVDESSQTEQSDVESQILDEVVSDTESILPQESTESDSESAIYLEDVSEESVPTESISDTEISESEESVPTEPISNSEVSESEENSTEEVVEEVTDESTDESVSDTSAETVLDDDVVSSSTSEESIPSETDEELAQEESGATEEPLETDATPTPTTTAVVTVAQPELHTVNGEENAYTFSLSDCARVADGSFYCSQSNGSEKVIDDRVFSAPDSEGDNEIFVEKNGAISQFTFNASDDAAPFFDDRSDTVVFHRLVDARYQIVSLDLETGEETQLTHDSYNNMQPSRYGDLTVWQGWVGNDWEILKEENGEITMLTDNTTHDIGPRINGDYIIWQSESAEGWTVRVYNTLTGYSESIDETDGASIENPRLVLVYDAKHENGDIETRGYDLDTGKNITLAAEAEKVPDEIPNPDQTGEERALITNVTQLKTKTEEDDTDEGLTPPLEPVDDTQVSATSTDDVVVPPFENTLQTENDALMQPDSTVPPDISDIVIPPSSSIDEELPLPDLIIPPLDLEEVIPTPIELEVARVN